MDEWLHWARESIDRPERRRFAREVSEVVLLAQGFRPIREIWEELASKPRENSK